jgi:hypothetical protein
MPDPGLTPDPDLDVAAYGAEHLAAARALLPALATFGLPAAVRLPAAPDVALADALVTVARGARLTGPLLAAVRRGQIHLAPAVRARLEHEHEHALFWCLRLEHRLLAVDAQFRAAGIPFLVLKGSAFAHLDLVDPAERTWADIDLLVPAGHLDRAVALVEADGAVRSYAEPRPGWDRRFGKSVELRRPDGVEIDIHRTLADGVYGARIPLDHLFGSADQFELGGRPFAALSPPGRALHAAYHAVVGSIRPSWSNLRDVARLFTSAQVPLAQVVAEAARWRGEAVLVAAVDLARTEVRVDAPAWFRWADTVEVDAHERVLVSRLCQGYAGAGRARLDLVRELGSFGERAAYLRGLAFPADARASVLTRYRRWLPHILRGS